MHSLGFTSVRPFPFSVSPLFSAQKMKRGIDLVVASAALILVSPLLVVITVMVMGDGGSPLFRQQRVGQGGRSFICYKFRTMKIKSESVWQSYLRDNPQAAKEWHLYQKISHDPRRTGVGSVLRRLSLDELPQLWNILKGEMSVVGPRPILPGQEKFYGDDYAAYCSVRPGLTGPWQVGGRNRLTFQQRVHLDVDYARRWSLIEDIKIMLRTLPALLRYHETY